MEVKQYKKYHRKHKIKKNENSSYRMRDLKKGFYGLKLIESGIVTPAQLETARRIITRITKRTSKIYINVCCNHPLTKKPLLSRMGKGSGSINSWISYVKKGKIIIEVKEVSKKLIFLAFKAVQRRIPIKMFIIKREVIDA